MRVCQRRAWGSAAAAVCRTGGVQQRLTVGLHAFMLVLRAMKERGTWLAGCALRGGDVAGVSRMRAALPRAGETSQLLARSTCWQQPRARARRSAAGVRRQAHRYLGRHHHATVMTWAGWTRHVTARASERRERLERMKGDGGGPCTIFCSRLNCDRLNCAVSSRPDTVQTITVQTWKENRARAAIDRLSCVQDALAARKLVL